MSRAPRGRLRIATYNVHGWVGGDGRNDPARVQAVLEELEADVIALQEVRTGAAVSDPLERLGSALGMEAVRGVTLELGLAAQGNALLSRWPIEEHQRVDLSVPGREPRGAIDARIGSPAGALRVVATHLGVGTRERRAQAGWLAQRLARGRSGTAVLLGDMNEWMCGVGALLPLHRMLGRTPGPRTFPARLPLFSLDRIWVSPRRRMRRLHVHRTALARSASDHLPVVAEIDLGDAEEEPRTP